MKNQNLRQQHLPVALFLMTVVFTVGALGSFGYAWTLHRNLKAALAVTPSNGEPVSEKPKAEGENATQPQSQPQGQPQSQPDGPGGNRPHGRRRGGEGEGKPGAELPAEVAEALKTHPLFGSQPKQPPMLQAILGDSALISGQWIRAGEQQGPFKVLEIHNDKVAVEYEGNRQELTLWSNLPASESSGWSPPPSPPPPANAVPAARQTAEPKAGMKMPKIPSGEKIRNFVKQKLARNTPPKLTDEQKKEKQERLRQQREERRERMQNESAGERQPAGGN